MRSDAREALQPDECGHRLAAVRRDLAAGKAVVLRDGGNGVDAHLISAAAAATDETIALMQRYGTGAICIALTPQADEAFDDMARLGPEAVVTTARWGGVLVSPTPSNVSVDLARLAGVDAVGLWVGLKAPAGDEPGGWLARLCREHELASLSIVEIVEYRRENTAPRVAFTGIETRLPTRFGRFALQLFEERLTGQLHSAMTMGELDAHGAVLTRVHSECFTGDVLGSLRCDCGEQLDHALQAIADAGRGTLVYLRQEGRGIGLDNKLRAYALQDKGLDTVEANERLGFPADLRDFSAAAEILAHLGIDEVELMTNNPAKIAGLESHGVKVVRRVPLTATVSCENRRYLETKRRKLGHLIAEDTTLHES